MNRDINKNRRERTECHLSTTVSWEQFLKVYLTLKNVLSSLGQYICPDAMIFLEITWGSLHCRKLNAAGFIKVFRSTIYL